MPLCVFGPYNCPLGTVFVTDDVKALTGTKNKGAKNGVAVFGDLSLCEQLKFVLSFHSKLSLVTQSQIL